MPSDPRAILSDVFGHAAFQGLQAEVIEHLLTGGHAVVLSPTGSGKSICYQVPALALPLGAFTILPALAARWARPGWPAALAFAAAWLATEGFHAAGFCLNRFQW